MAADLFPAELTRAARDVFTICLERGLTVATAESCTGGLIAGALTEIPGASDVFLCGYVTYANAAKMRDLSVPEELLEAYGAVSAEVALAMAEGAVERTGADIGIAVTGIAGPGGATETKPLGLVHMAATRRNHATLEERHIFPGDRTAVRLAAATAALALALRATTL